MYLRIHVWIDPSELLKIWIPKPLLCPNPSKASHLQQSHFAFWITKWKIKLKAAFHIRELFRPHSWAPGLLPAGLVLTIRPLCSSVWHTGSQRTLISDRVTLRPWWSEKKVRSLCNPQNAIRPVSLNVRLLVLYHFQLYPHSGLPSLSIKCIEILIHTISLLSDRVSSQFLTASQELPNQNLNPLIPRVPIKEKLLQMELCGQGRFYSWLLQQGRESQLNSTKTKIKWVFKSRISGGKK